VTLALTWGGVAAPWHSAKTLVPLCQVCLVFITLIAFVIYEAESACIKLLATRFELNHPGNCQRDFCRPSLSQSQP